MKITKVEAIPLTLNRKDGGHPSNVVLVKIHTDEGIIGAAEGGTCGQDAAMLSIKMWEPFLIGADPMDIQIIVSRLSRFMGGNASTVGTLDFALYDIIGKALNMPVWKVLGGKANEKLALGMMISGGTPKERADKAAKAVAAGINTVVCKVGPGWGTPTIFDDVKNVKAIREAVGDDIFVGVDANGGLDYSTALDLSLRLEQFNVCRVEQPIPTWDVDGLARLHRKLHVPVTAHESAITIPGLLECIKKDACDSVCIKVVWTGGILKSKEWLAICKAANLAISCGSMVGSSYEAAAQAHFLASDSWCSKMAHANLGPPLIHNTFDTTGVKDDLSVNCCQFKDGYFWAPDGPGLGLELNEKLIPKMITKGKAPLTIGK